MKTLEQFHAEQARALAQFTEQSNIVQSLTNAGAPVPDHVGGITHGARHIAYFNRQNRTLSQALEIFKIFPLIRPVVVHRGTFTTIAPESAPISKNSTPGNTDFALWLYVSHVDNGAPFAKLGFCAVVDGVEFSVGVAFGSDYIGASHALKSGFTETTDMHDRVQSRRFTGNPDLRGMSDEMLKFASGDYGQVEKSANHVYLLCADHGADDCQPLECSHALAMLQNVIDNLGV